MKKVPVKTMRTFWLKIRILVKMGTFLFLKLGSGDFFFILVYFLQLCMLNGIFRHLINGLELHSKIPVY